VSQRAAWSPVYTSSNPPPATGELQLVGTVSHVFSDGSASSPAHQMMPAFMWSGDESEDGKAWELFRVEIFTDKQCLNRVYTGAVVGSPSWAPRLNGPLALPQDPTAFAAARSGYLGDGKESSSYTYDGAKLEPAEQQPPATPTTNVPGEVPAFPGTTPPGSAPADPGSGSSAGSSGGSQAVKVTGSVGPPVSLWDVD
jgi:hypothetical protein